MNNNSNRVYRVPRTKVDYFGRMVASPSTPKDFIHLVGIDVNSIILYNNGTDELLASGATILPRHYVIFVGTRDGEVQYKPYEFNPYRIVVSTYKGIIVSVDSIG